MKPILIVSLLVISVVPALAQDVPGIELCTASNAWIGAPAACRVMSNICSS